MLAAGLLIVALTLFAPLRALALPMPAPCGAGIAVRSLGDNTLVARSDHDFRPPACQPSPFRRHDANGQTAIGGNGADGQDGGNGADGQDANGQNGGIVIDGVPYPPDTSGTFSTSSGQTVTLDHGRVVSVDGPEGHISFGRRSIRKRGNANGGNAVGGNGGNGQDGQDAVGQNGGVSIGGGDADCDDNVAGVDIPAGTNGTFEIGGHTVVIQNGHIVSVDGQPFGAGSTGNGEDGQVGEDGQNGQDGQDGTATPGKPGIVIGSGSAHGGSATPGKGGKGGSAKGGDGGVVVGGGSANGGNAVGGN